MADLSLDELLSSSLKSAAEPANSAGVADAIRARVAAGDTGTSVASSTAPGWTPPRPRWIGPMIGAIAGLTAVLAVLIGVLLWPASPAPVVTPEATPTVAPTPTITVTPTPTPTPTEVAPPPPPPPPADTTPPKISAGQWSSAEVYSTGSSCEPTSADIAVTASDDTRVSDVSASSDTRGTSVVFVSSSKGSYVFRFSGATPTPDPEQVTVTFTAVDDAGNTSRASRPILLQPQCSIIG